MKHNRVLTSLFLAFALLFAQQAGAAHAFSHAVERQQDKQAPDSPACDKCEQYAQMGSALHAAPLDLPFANATSASAPQQANSLHSADILAAAARGPPASF